MLGVEPFVEYLVEQQQRIADGVVQKSLCQEEVVFVIQHVEVVYDGLVGDVPSGEAGNLVEDGEGVAHPSVRFLGNDVQGVVFGRYTLLRGDVLQLFHNIGYPDALKVVYLATGENRRQNFVLFRRGQDKDGMVRREGSQTVFCRAVS